MAEMTVEKAIAWLTSDKAFGQECYSRKQIAALLESQAAEIEKLKAMLDCGVQEMAEADKEIAKKDRMIWRMRNCRNCKQFANNCAKADLTPCIAWQWLEKEAEGVEYDGRRI